VKKSTATWPFADYTDFFCNFALYETKQGSDMIHLYLQTFSTTIQLLLDGSISPTIATTFHSTYFLALHKSTLSNSAPLALALPSGTSSAQYLSNTSQLTLHHISSPADNLALASMVASKPLSTSPTQGLSPTSHVLFTPTPPQATHVMLLLDIINMFN
jgi:hypothetical protein